MCVCVWMGGSERCKSVPETWSPITPHPYVQAQRVLLQNRPSLPYDVLSLNLGITPALSIVPGAAENTTPVKPINGCAPCEILNCPSAAALGGVAATAGDSRLPGGGRTLSGRPPCPGLYPWLQAGGPFRGAARQSSGGRHASGSRSGWRWPQWCGAGLRLAVQVSSRAAAAAAAGWRQWEKHGTAEKCAGRAWLQGIAAAAHLYLPHPPSDPLRAAG